MSPSFNPENSVHQAKRTSLLVLLLIPELSRYMPKKKEVYLKKLINTGEEQEDHHGQVPESKDSKDQPIVSYWHSNLTLGIVTDVSALQIKTLHPAVSQRNCPQIRN